VIESRHCDDVAKRLQETHYYSITGYLRKNDSDGLRVDGTIKRYLRLRNHDDDDDDDDGGGGAGGGVDGGGCNDAMWIE